MSKKLTFLNIAAAFTAVLFCVSVTEPQAAQTTYDLSGVTAPYSGGGIETLSGSFVFDPATQTLSSVNITVTNPINSTDPYIGQYTQALFVHANTDWIGGQLTADSLRIGAPGVASLGLSFLSPLSNTSENVFQVGNSLWRDASGSVSPVPLPGALPLFASAIVGIGAFARRRAKKTA